MCRKVVAIYEHPYWKDRPAPQIFKDAWLKETLALLDAEEAEDNTKLLNCQQFALSTKS